MARVRYLSFIYPPALELGVASLQLALKNKLLLLINLGKFQHFLKVLTEQIKSRVSSLGWSTVIIKNLKKCWENHLKGEH